MKYEGSVTIKFDSSTTTRTALETLGAAYSKLPDWSSAEWGEKVEEFRRFIGAFHWEEGRCASMVIRDCFSAEEEFGRAVRCVLRIVGEGITGKPFSMQATCDANNGAACDVVCNYIGFGDITVEETLYPRGRLSLIDYCCLECGNPIINAKDCNPNIIYVCKECGKEVGFAEQYSAHEPKYEMYSVHIKGYTC